MSIVNRVVDAITTLITAPFRAIAALFGRRGEAEAEAEAEAAHGGAEPPWVCPACEADLAHAINCR